MLTACPLKVIPPEAWDALATARRWREAHMAPVAGGWLDQTAFFVDLIEFIEAERGEMLRQIEDKLSHGRR